MVGTRRLTALTESMKARLRLPDEPLVVGLSGGADSAALAYLSAHRDMRLVHVDHGLPNSQRMRDAAEEVAGDLDLKLEVVEVVVPDGASPEGQARRARYLAFSERVMADEKLLTGHTRDDNAETVLMNVVRGTGPRGLGGIPYHRSPNVYRPMLDITRSETRELAALAGIPFVDDPMNDDLDLTRNIVRSKVLPALVDLNPQLVDSLSRMAAAVTVDNSMLDEKASQVAVQHSERGSAVAVGDLLALPIPVADRVLKRLLSDVLGADEVTSDRVQGLRSVADGTGSGFDVGSGVGASRQGPYLVLESQPAVTENQRIDLVPGYHRWGRLALDVISSDQVCRVAPLSNWSALFPAGTALQLDEGGVVRANGEPAWIPGQQRFPVSWYDPGSIGYLSVFATEVTGWISSH